MNRVEGVSLGVPARLSGGGATEIVEWDLSDAERAAFRAGARTVREAAASL